MNFTHILSKASRVAPRPLMYVLHRVQCDAGADHWATPCGLLNVCSMGMVYLVLDMQRFPYPLERRKKNFVQHAVP